MGTKKRPGKFDCYANALDDEPMFVLLARDLLAPGLIRQWANVRQTQILAGDRPAEDWPMVTEALTLAIEMQEWRRDNPDKWRPRPPEPPSAIKTATAPLRQRT